MKISALMTLISFSNYLTRSAYDSFIRTDINMCHKFIKSVAVLIRTIEFFLTQMINELRTSKSRVNALFLMVSQEFKLDPFITFLIHTFDLKLTFSHDSFNHMRYI